MVYEKKGCNVHQWQIRGVMLDPARHTERYDYYKTLIPRLADWGFNTILLHLLDHEGSAIQLESPKLLATRGALTPDQWRSLVQLASDNGIMMIPEIEVLGHSGYLTRLPEYSELCDGRPDGAGWKFCLSPAHSRTLGIVETICDAVDGIFPAEYVHIGMDESDIGSNPHTALALKEKSIAKIYCDYITQVNDIIRKRNKRAMMWADHLLALPELSESLPKNIIACNWLYGRGHSEKYAETTRMLLDRGYEVIGCPAGVWSGTQLAPHSDNLANIRDLNDACRQVNSERILGMICTMWCPYRHLPAAGHPVMHYAARVFSGQSDDFGSTVASFISGDFELEGAELAEVADAIAALHTRRTRNKVEMDIMLGDAARIAKDRDDVQNLYQLAVHSEDVLNRAASSVRRNQSGFSQWQLTVRTLRELAEIGVNGSEEDSRALRQILADRIRENYLRFRDYAGTSEDEPYMNQLHWHRSDHPLELLKA